MRLHALAAAGDMLRALDRRGRTPLQWAAQAGRHEDLRVLLPAGADPSPLDDLEYSEIAVAQGALHSKGQPQATAKGLAEFGLLQF